MIFGEFGFQRRSFPFCVSFKVFYVTAEKPSLFFYRVDDTADYQNETNLHNTEL